MVRIADRAVSLDDIYRQRRRVAPVPSGVQWRALALELIARMPERKAAALMSKHYRRKPVEPPQTNPEAHLEVKALSPPAFQ